MGAKAPQTRLTYPNPEDRGQNGGRIGESLNGSRDVSPKPTSPPPPTSQAVIAPPAPPPKKK
jgi:hypothetical protein